MPASVGPVKIPLQSTFDPTGIIQAKAGLKELSETKVGGGARGGGGGAAPAAPTRAAYADDADHIFEQTRTANEKYEYQVRKLDDLHKKGAISTETYRRAQKQALDILPKAPTWMQRMGLGQAGKTVAGEAGLGGIVGGFGAAGAVAGIAAVGVAVFALTQRIAGQAIAARDNARALGVSTEYYHSLATSARRAGTDVSTVTNAMAGVRSTAEAVATGSDIGKAIFLRSLGISRSDLSADLGDTEALAKRMYAAAKTPGQKAALFGSVAAADAVGNARPAWYTPTMGEVQSAAGLKAGAEGLGTKIMGGLGGALHNLDAFVFGGQYRSKAGDDADAAAQHYREIKAQREKTFTDAGRALLPSLVNPLEMQKYLQEARKDFIFSAKPEEQARFQRLAQAQAAEQSNAARASNLDPRTLAELETSAWRQKFDNGGFASRAEGLRAEVQIRQREAGALAPVRSNAENLQAQIGLFAKAWAAEAPGEEDDADPEHKQALAANLRRMEKARSMGEQITDYAESITRSGSLAGAADVNSVAGYSQLVGAEYSMDQSKDTMRMVELLIKIAENTGRMTKTQGDAVLDELGFRGRDIFGIGG